MHVDWSEIYYTFEGEGPYSGHPLIFVRFAKCNMKCAGFNNPDKLNTQDIHVLGFDPKTITKLEDMPAITKGCDSIYSWDNQFSHLWKRGDIHDLDEAIQSVYPAFKSDFAPLPILSLTGGEPLLRMKAIIELLTKATVCVCFDHVIFETNGSVVIKPEHVIQLQDAATTYGYKLTGSISPKLACSGEPKEKAYNPEAINSIYDSCTETYFKFVADSQKDFDEIWDWIDEYKEDGVPVDDIPIYVMPMACTEEQQRENSKRVAQLCMEYGYNYCHRVHNTVLGNGAGT